MRRKARGHASEAIFERHFWGFLALNGVEELHMLEVGSAVMKTVVFDRVIPDLSRFDFGLGSIMCPLFEITDCASFSMS